ncbi:MAG: hypothetical protein AB1571_04250 [Nanoarchaeota archaeon]
MISLTYNQIIERILREKDINKQELENKVEAKLSELSNLISKEGAAHIVANELNVKLFEPLSTLMKISDIMSGMRSINILGKVITLYPVREYKKELRSGRIASMLIGDETGVIRLVIWDENLIQNIKDIKVNDIIKINNAYCKENNNYKELHLGSKGQLLINPEGQTVGDVVITYVLAQKCIKDLKENEQAKIIGTIVQLFEPRFYEVCPICGKRTRLENQDYVCDEHNKIKPRLVPVVNLYLDDGTSNIRVIFFRNTAYSLFNIPEEKIESLRDTNNFDAIRKEILGKQVVLKGRVVRNTMFNNLEFVAKNITELKPEELIAMRQ